MNSTRRLQGHTISLTHVDKIYFPSQDTKDAVTKGMVLDYYERVSPWLLPHLKNRPLTLQRFPEGITGPWFYQKNTPAHVPDWISTQRVRGKNKQSVIYLVCQNSATLLYIVNQGCITPHRWLSRIPRLNYPDQMIFDLDPPATIDFERIKALAHMLREILQAAGWQPWVMTTGSRGLHVGCTLKPAATFDTVRAYAREIAQQAIAQDPAHLTLVARKTERKNRILIDIMRNSYGATAVAPYALRAIPGAPVATPLTWKELDGVPHAQAYTLKNIFRRLAHTSADAG
jgi:bifunctional non-homologous end joining protein LigD